MTKRAVDSVFDGGRPITPGGLAWWDSTRIVVAAAAISVLLLLASRAGYVPIWDGRIYAECIMAAARPPFFLSELRCATHASQAYLAYMALVQRMAPASYLPMLVANTVLLVVAAFGFARLAKLVFPSAALRLDRALLLAAFTLQPSILAAVVQPGLDLPLLPGFVWSAVFFIERRWVLLCLTGLWLAFSKETGVLLYGVMLASYGVWFLVTGTGTALSRLRAVLRLAPLAAPLAVFASYLVYRATSAPKAETVLWSASGTGGSLLHQFLVPRLDLYLINYLAILLVLNFAWVATVWIGLDAFVGAVRTAHRLERREVPGAVPGLVGFLVLTSLAVAYALTRFATFGNSRYLIPAIGLLLVPFMASMLRLGLPVVARRAMLGGFATAMLVSTLRTVDPVSRALYTTFPVGGHRMLRMTRITRECCGAGRDQLVYSLEFTVLADLTSDAMAATAVDDSTLVVIPDLTAWDAIGRIDSLTRRRTLSVRRAFQPKELEFDSLLKVPVAFKRAVFVGLPYGDVDSASRALRATYDVYDEQRLRRGGYWLDAFGLRPNGPRPPQFGVPSASDGATR
jgi:hypothetical protein